MDKKTAVRTLTKELGGKFGRQIVTEEVYKQQLVKNASHVYQLGNPLLVDFMNERYSCDGISINGRDMLNLLDILLTKNSSFTEANYIFLGNTPGGEKAFTDTRFTATAYALVGQDEMHNLERNFYKNISSDTLFAMDTLGIKNFTRIYELYKDTKKSNFEAKLIKEFIDCVSRLQYDSDGEIDKQHLASFGGVDKLNEYIRKLGVTARISTTDDRKSSIKSYPSLIHNKNLSRVLGELQTKKDLEHIFFSEYLSGLDKNFLNEFFNFVFSLPYEDQNLKVNKDILRLHGGQVDYVNILVKEYVKGNYFQEYFDILNSNKQKQVVLTLNTISERNPSHDSFLWKKGFKDVDVDYMVLYKTDSESFIDYFAGRTTDEKRIILKDIMDSDFINDKVTVWLNDGYLDLMREVGFNG